MIQANRDIFFEHAKAQMPREACALVLVKKGREVLQICKNNSLLADQFALDPDDYAKASLLGEITGVVHSHVNVSAHPTEADKVSCEATGLEWHICSVPNGTWISFKPSGYKAPLVGRTWAHGILDCYSLVRDYYRETLNIQLLDFNREFEWWDKGWNLYCEENFAKAGFFQVPKEEIRKHDGILMQIKSPVANHAGVYLGDDQFLHHLNRRLSSRDVFAGYYRKHTVKVLRHKDA